MKLVIKHHSTNDETSKPGQDYPLSNIGIVLMAYREKVAYETINVAYESK